MRKISIALLIIQIFGFKRVQVFKVFASNEWKSVKSG